jgi:hypothetical protein
MREEEIIKEFQKFHSCLVVPDELTTDFKQFEAYVRKEEDKWLRQTLTTYRAQVLEEEKKRIKKRVVGLGWSAENETPDAIRILKEIYDLLEHPTN